MIELLILYSLNKREKTAYGVRKDILEFFGNFSEPSFGTIHPALKRLEKSGCITSKSNFSTGGRKSSYFNLTPKAKAYFRNLFLTELAQNPVSFKMELQIRLATLSMLEKNDRKDFLADALQKLELFQININKTLKDDYSSLDEYQKQLHQKELENLDREILFIKKLRANNA